jgi:hypothetical protein
MNLKFFWNNGVYFQQGNETTAEKEMKAQVSRCAKEITGDDRPRKLDPIVRAKVMSLTLSDFEVHAFQHRWLQVMDCAFAYMPEMDTEGLLRESERQLMASAKVFGKHLMFAAAVLTSTSAARS